MKYLFISLFVLFFSCREKEEPPLSCADYFRKNMSGTAVLVSDDSLLYRLREKDTSGLAYKGRDTLRFERWRGRVLQDTITFTGQGRFIHRRKGYPSTFGNNCSINVYHEALGLNFISPLSQTPLQFSVYAEYSPWWEYRYDSAYITFSRNDLWQGSMAPSYEIYGKSYSNVWFMTRANESGLVECILNQELELFMLRINKEVMLLRIR